MGDPVRLREAAEDVWFLILDAAWPDVQPTSGQLAFEAIEGGGPDVVW